MKPESFTKKLFIARDVEGKPNDKELIALREVEKQLSQDPLFIGLAPFGSVVGGYSTEQSDVDVYILEDYLPAQRESPAEKLRNELITTKLDEIAKRLHIHIHFIITHINPEIMLQNLALGIERGNPCAYIETQLAEMSRLVTGKKINKYRKIIADELQKLSPEQQQQVANNIIESLVRRDVMSFSKRERRIPELTEEDHQRILNEREKMWTKRVKTIWNIK
ncbi:MAG: hypothetical protein Q8R36_03315 [bacterium]|nr:hypothetical protein [bacterium]